jgi:hypothetical protein
MLSASNAVNKSIAISLGCSLAGLVTTGQAANVGSDGGLSKGTFLLYPPADFRCPPEHLLCPPADLLYRPSDARPFFPTVPPPRSETPRTPPASSGAPAKELYGKSIVVSWFESRILDEGRGGLQSRTITIYVSTLGRTFTKLLVVLGNPRGGLESGGHHRNASTEHGPGERQARGAVVSSTKFAGHSLIMTSQFESGARRIVVDFDGGLTSCQAKVDYSKERGRSTLRQVSLFSGQTVEVRAIEVSGVRCTLREGNVFTES